MAKAAPGAEKIAGVAGDNAAPVTQARDRTRGEWRWVWPVVIVAGIALLFTAFLGLSNTTAENSDEANILLMASDMLHGNITLHNWVTSDVPFISTELPQIAILVWIFGLKLQTAHIASAMTYTLVVVLGAFLAKGKATGAQGWCRALLAAGIMLAPQPGTGVFVLILSVGHIGTAVPIMVAWLVLDRCGRQRWVPPVMALLLAWALVADPLVVVIAILPVFAVCLTRFVTMIFRTGGGLGTRLAGAARARFFEISLAAAAGAGWGIAWGFNKLITVSGGYSQKPVPYSLDPFRTWLWHSKVSLSGLLSMFGANFVGQSGFAAFLSILHLLGLTLAFWGMLAVARRFFLRDADIVSQLLTVAIVANLAAYIPSALADASALNAREFAPVLPFAAVVAGRMLGGRLPLTKPRRQVIVPGLLLALVGYGYTLGHGALEPAAPVKYAGLVSWLESLHANYGLSGYWQASLITVETEGRVTLRAVEGCSFQPYPWEMNTTWYDPSKHDARMLFLDLGRQQGFEGAFRGNLTAERTINQMIKPRKFADHYVGPSGQANGARGLFEARVYPVSLLTLLSNHDKLPVNAPDCQPKAVKGGKKLAPPKTGTATKPSSSAADDPMTASSGR